MVGEYNIDQNKIHEFYRQGLISYSISIGCIWLIFMLVIFIVIKDPNPFILAGIITVVHVVFIGGWMARTGERTFEKTQIIIEHDRIIRKGKGLNTVSIKFNEIGRIVSQRNALIIVRRGVWPSIQYYIHQNSYISNQNIMYIPIMIDEFEKIKQHIKLMRHD